LSDTLPIFGILFISLAAIADTRITLYEGYAYELASPYQIRILSANGREALPGRIIAREVTRNEKAVSLQYPLVYTGPSGYDAFSVSQKSDLSAVCSFVAPGYNFATYQISSTVFSKIVVLGGQIGVTPVARVLQQADGYPVVDLICFKNKLDRDRHSWGGGV
jgi:hypothetical protein